MIGLRYPFAEDDDAVRAPWGFAATEHAGAATDLRTADPDAWLSRPPR